MIKKIVFLVSILLVGCASTGEYYNIYKGTPYDLYASKSKQSILNDEIHRVFFNADDIDAHREIMKMAYNRRHYGLSLFAANEAYQRKKNNPRISYSIGILLGVLGLKEDAAARLLYAANKSTNDDIKKSATKALFDLDEKGVIEHGKYPL